MYLIRCGVVRCVHICGTFGVECWFRVQRWLNDKTFQPSPLSRRAQADSVLVRSRSDGAMVISNPCCRPLRQADNIQKKLSGLSVTSSATVG